MKTLKELTRRDWWLGMADLASAGAAATATRLERVHLSIADETFNVLARIPVTRPVSQRVRQLHHGISAVSYRSVSAGASAFNRCLREPLIKSIGESASLEGLSAVVYHYRRESPGMVWAACGTPLPRFATPSRKALKACP